MKLVSKCERSFRESKIPSYKTGSKEQGFGQLGWPILTMKQIWDEAVSQVLTNSCRIDEYIPRLDVERKWFSIVDGREESRYIRQRQHIPQVVYQEWLRHLQLHVNEILWKYKGYVKHWL